MKQFVIGRRQQLGAGALSLKGRGKGFDAAMAALPGGQWSQWQITLMGLE